MSNLKFEINALKVRHLLSGLVIWFSSFSALAYDAEITVGYGSDPVSLDIHESLSEDTLQFAHLVFDPLIRRNQKMQYMPRLAQRWQRIDDLTTRFYLQPQIKFHSGNTLTSQDVAWTLERLKRSVDYKGLFERVSHIKVIDETRFDLVTKTPYPLVLQLASYLFVMDSAFYTGVDENGQDKSKIEKQGDTFAASNTSGSGPYQVTLREQGMQLKLTRFADYWDRESPGNVKHLSLIPIKEPSTRLAALLSGDVDIITPVAPLEFANLADQPLFSALTWPGTRLISVQLNQSNNAALQDRRVRQAIIYAVNNQGIADQLMQGFATAASQQSPPGYLGHNPYLVVRYDLAKARKLMKQAGFEKGFELSMIAPNGRYINDVKVAQAVAAMLQKINIRVNLKTYPITEYWPKFDRCEADLLMIGWQSDTHDSANYSEYLTMTRDADSGRGQYNCGYYSNPKVDDLVLKANQEVDPMPRGQMLREVELLLYEDAAFLPLHWERLGWAAKKNIRLKGVVNPDNTSYFGDLQVDEFESQPSLPLLRSRRQ